MGWNTVISKGLDAYAESVFETSQTVCSCLIYTVDRELQMYVPTLIYKGILNMEVLSDKSTSLFSKNDLSYSNLG